MYTYCDLFTVLLPPSGQKLWPFWTHQVHSPGGPGHHIVWLGLGPGQRSEQQVLQAEGSRREGRLRPAHREEEEDLEASWDVFLAAAGQTDLHPAETTSLSGTSHCGRRQTDSTNCWSNKVVAFLSMSACRSSLCGHSCRSWGRSSEHNNLQWLFRKSTFQNM